jgi:mannan endo-1,4-beta-mannosidase
MHLGAAGNEQGRERLVRELDGLAELGVTNLRVMAGSEGPATEPWRVQPAVQSSPGVFDEDLLQGLDFLLAEMARRDMKAVLVLSNFFHWSGGMAQYVSWATGTPIPYPNDGSHTWDEFQNYSALFYGNRDARRLYLDFAYTLAHRVSSITGHPYRDDPTIMAWQLANEPRGFAMSASYVEWVDEAAGFLQLIAPRHLVSVGGEGKLLPENGTQFERVSQSPYVDYLTFHLWVENWSWFDPARPEATYDSALGRAMAYVADHVAIAEQLDKPIVLEEFGMSRDEGSFEPSAGTRWRDRYFKTLFEMQLDLAAQGSALAGLNVWSWSGEGIGVEPGVYWKPGEPLTGDPPHELQGWYAIFDGDRSTHNVLSKYARRVSELYAP